MTQFKVVVLRRSKIMESASVVKTKSLSMVAIRDEDVDVSNLPHLCPHERVVRIIEVDTHLLGEYYGLAYMLDHGDGTYSESSEFPLSMFGDTPSEVVKQLDALDDDFVCWGLPSQMLKQAIMKNILVKSLSGYYEEC